MIIKQTHRHMASSTITMLIMILLLAACNPSTPIPLSFTTIFHNRNMRAFATPPKVSVKLLSAPHDGEELLVPPYKFLTFEEQDEKQFQQLSTTDYTDTINILVWEKNIYAADAPPPMLTILHASLIDQTIQITIQAPPEVSCKNNSNGMLRVCSNIVEGKMGNSYQLVQISRQHIPPGEYHIQVIYPDGKTVAESTAVVAPAPLR